MTNTLHRYGSAESFADDYIVFATPSNGRNEIGSLPKLKKFLELALPFKPVNVGDPVHGGALRPQKDLHTSSNWKRDMAPDFQAVIDGLSEPASVVAIFDNQAAAEQFLKVAVEADLGLSVNMSTSVEGAVECCKFAGITRHSVGYSLGFEGSTEKLPNSQALTLSTMCGHGMISSSLAKKMIDWVKEGRRTPAEAVTYMTRFCSCGVFNPVRAQRILEEARKKME
jgi:hypothetical protein